MVAKTTNGDANHGVVVGFHPCEVFHGNAGQACSGKLAIGMGGIALFLLNSHNFGLLCTDITIFV